MTAAARGLALLCLLLAGTAAAGEDSDLDLLPKTAPLAPSDTSPPAAGAPNQRIYLEDAVVASALRGSLPVPYPPPQPPNWQEHLFFDARKVWKAGDTLSFSLGDRFNLRAENDLQFPTHENVVNELREVYVSWMPFDSSYLDVGRINLKSGVSLGFNPTDFFRSRAVVQTLSVDPSVLREDRLGTLLAQVQHIWEDSAITVAFAPKLYDPTPIYTDSDLSSLDPAFDRTNAAHRFLVKGDLKLTGDFAPELLLYREGSRTAFGFNAAESLGQSVVAYAEWSGGRRASLVAEAQDYGRQTGTLPAAVPDLLPGDTAPHFQNQLSTGVSYTTESRVTFNFEYHYFQPGFSGDDWRNWFQAGQTQAAAPALWYIRSYAFDQQDPVARHSLFARFDWIDAFVSQLELSGFISTDLSDRSSLVQVQASYYISNAWTVGGLFIADPGRRHSDFGSLPQQGSVLLMIARYF